MKEIDILKKKTLYVFIVILFIIVFCIAILNLMEHFDLTQKEYYSASDFDIKTIYSSVDFDNDKIDDYSDIVLGARKDAKNKPEYTNKYYETAYPPDNEGVCTDVVWRAFKNAGYSLRLMVDNDIKSYPEDYPNIKYRDSNIDFRRVVNLNVFFARYSEILTTDPKDIAAWQPGDIVIFENAHIGIISDRRNSKGIPYVIHNNGQLNREEDYLTKRPISAHYRFNASKIPKEILIPWEK